MTNKYYFSKIVIKDFILGFSLFLLTEILIFVALFWAWTYSAINPSIWVGSVWPPVGIQAPNPTALPLYSTYILFTSSCSLMWFELALQLRSRQAEVLLALTLTLSNGLFFLVIQTLEFIRLPFTFTDSIYGNLFFSITGLHFLHIIVGLFLLTLVCYRLCFNGVSFYSTFTK